MQKISAQMRVSESGAAQSRLKSRDVFFGKVSDLGQFIVPAAIQAILDGFGQFFLCSSL